MSRALFGRVATATVALAAAAIVVLSGSTSGQPSASESSVRPVAQRQTESPVSEPTTLSGKYVALGSSYAAGPDGPESLTNRCFRTSDNYPHQVAEALGMSLIDATCSGATTSNIIDRAQRFTSKPQIDAVTPDTALVTITTGGNDIGYIQRLISMSCRNVVPELAREVAARGCRLGRPMPSEPGPVQYDKVAEKIAETVYAVRLRAPLARILVVDYPPVVVSGGPTCAKLPLSPLEIASTIRVYDGLAAATARGAEISGAGLVQTSGIGAFHTVCSADPWLRGFELPVPYHPNAAGKAGVAKLVINAVR